VSEKAAAAEPTGTPRGSVTNYYTGDEFMNRLLRELPLLRADAILPGTRAAMRAYNALGVTTVYAGHARGDPRLQRARRDDRLRGARDGLGAHRGLPHPAPRGRPHRPRAHRA